MDRKDDVIDRKKHHRSTSNNRPGINKEKYKNTDASGPITAKNSKLPDAFLDVNYKGKRSMKQIAKVDKRHHDSSYYKSSRNNDPVQPKSSHGKSKKKKEHEPSPKAYKEEDKVGEDDYRQGVKSKPKIISGKLPSAFSNPQMKYKGSKNEQYIKQMKDSNRGEEARKSKQNTLDPIPIPMDRQKKMKNALNGATKNESKLKYESMGASKSNGFGGFK